MGIITDFKQNDKWIGLGKMEIQVVARSPVPPAGEAEMRQHPGVWGRRPQREFRGQRPLVPAAQARNKQDSLSDGVHIYERERKKPEHPFSELR